MTLLTPTQVGKMPFFFLRWQKNLLLLDLRETSKQMSRSLLRTVAALSRHRFSALSSTVK
jgi:hypothetical protein